jgi:D-serine deaminase-like pyridoxal phosphate-dependent protein
MTYQDSRLTPRDEAIGLLKEEVDTPFLWVDLVLLEQNIERMAARTRAAGVRWRPHIKGIKVPALAWKCLQAGAIGVTCAKLGEAEVMVAAGIQDILIANQIVGRAKVERLVRLISETGAAVKVAVDSIENVRQIGEAANRLGIIAGAVVEVDVGMKRAGVAPGEAAVALSQMVASTPGIAYCGLMAWEGHTVGIADTEEKRSAIEAAIRRLEETRDACLAAGLRVEIVSAGGSATFEVTADQPPITEVQAGGGIFSDVLYRQRGVKNEPALFVRSTISSKPAPDRLVFDAGFKALPSWKADPIPVGLSHVAGIRLSAEHATVTLSVPNEQAKIGDAYDFVVTYGDYTVCLHDMLYGIRHGRVEHVWPIEGRGKLR